MILVINGLTTKHQTADLIPTYNCATLQHNSNVFHLKALSVCKKNPLKSKTIKQANQLQQHAVYQRSVSNGIPKMIGNRYETRSELFDSFLPGLCFVISIVKPFSCSDLYCRNRYCFRRDIFLLLFFVSA